jgi:hypothetical protein
VAEGRGRDGGSGRRAQYEARQREAARAAAPVVELRRLQGAAMLTCRPLGPTQYLVTGGREAHYVALAAEGVALPRCDCAYVLYRPKHFCKHILSALAAEGDAEIRAALSALTSVAQVAA